MDKSIGDQKLDQLYNELGINIKYQLMNKIIFKKFKIIQMKKKYQNYQKYQQKKKLMKN